VPSCQCMSRRESLVQKISCVTALKSEGHVVFALSLSMTHFKGECLTNADRN
jgi:hypothetical protein